MLYMMQESNNRLGTILSLTVWMLTSYVRLQHRTSYPTGTYYIVATGRSPCRVASSSQPQTASRSFESDHLSNESTRLKHVSADHQLPRVLMEHLFFVKRHKLFFVPPVTELLLPSVRLSVSIIRLILRGWGQSVERGMIWRMQYKNGHFLLFDLAISIIASSIPPKMRSVLALLTVLPLALGQATVYLIRHGEKPSSGNGLNAQGMQRAQCLRNVFGANSGYNIDTILTQQYKSGTYSSSSSAKCCIRISTDKTRRIPKASLRYRNSTGSGSRHHNQPLL